MCDARATATAEIGLCLHANTRRSSTYGARMVTELSVRYDGKVCAIMNSIYGYASIVPWLDDVVAHWHAQCMPTLLAHTMFFIFVNANMTFATLTFAEVAALLDNHFVDRMNTAYGPSWDVSREDASRVRAAALCFRGDAKLCLHVLINRTSPEDVVRFLRLYTHCRRCACIDDHSADA